MSISKSDKEQDSSKYEYEVKLENSDNFDRALTIFKTYGFVILKKSIPHLLISNILSDLQKVIEKNKISNTQRDIHFFKDGTVSSAHNLVNYIPNYLSLSNIPALNFFAEKLFGEISSKQFNSSYFAKPKRQGLETLAHQDNAYFCMEPPEVATCWIPITFANKSNGCLYYYPKSFTLGNLEHKPEGNLGASMSIPKNILDEINKNFVKTYIEIELGDCVIHNSLVIHGSESNLSEFDRNAFNFSFANKLANRNTDLHNAYQNNLSSFLEKKKS